MDIMKALAAKLSEEFPSFIVSLESKSIKALFSIFDGFEPVQFILTIPKGENSVLIKAKAGSISDKTLISFTCEEALLKEINNFIRNYIKSVFEHINQKVEIFLKKEKGFSPEDVYLSASELNSKQTKAFLTSKILSYGNLLENYEISFKVYDQLRNSKFMPSVIAHPGIFFHPGLNSIIISDLAKFYDIKFSNSSPVNNCTKSIIEIVEGKVGSIIDYKYVKQFKNKSFYNELCKSSYFKINFSERVENLKEVYWVNLSHPSIFASYLGRVKYLEIAFDYSPRGYSYSYPNLKETLKKVQVENIIIKSNKDHESVIRLLELITSKKSIINIFIIDEFHLFYNAKIMSSRLGGKNIYIGTFSPGLNSFSWTQLELEGE